MALFDEHLREKIRNLPTGPGVYQYFDSDGNIIYIGKAKNLRNRVSSYLNKSNQSSKTSVLVKKISDLKYTVVSTEQDALLLENNLIKEHKPKYNILLKDDKTFPWIVIRKESFPRVEITRKFNRDEAEYFGPYTSVKFANVLMKLIKKWQVMRSDWHFLYRHQHSRCCCCMRRYRYTAILWLHKITGEKNVFE
jgi:excinuclease ABC subunit C